MAPGLTEASWLLCRALGEKAFEVIAVEGQPLVLTDRF